MRNALKRLVKKLVPASLRAWRLRRHEIALLRPYSGNDPRQVFARIYEDGRWGGDGDGDFHSGGGSHDVRIVSPYVASIRAFATSFDRKLDVVDLGCGDFNVGSQLRDAFDAYKAYDVVPALIERNRRKYADLSVSFDSIDITRDPLPPGDVVLIRQVLQHLSNDQIGAVVAKLPQYRYAIITEHLPAQEGFRPNRDKPSGAAVRCTGAIAEHEGRSGVVLTAAPFGLTPRSEKVLCEMGDPDNPETVIRTILYEMR